jgi:prophage tail gpP-like protein
MSNPKQGTFYIVEYGDDLRSISRRAYGYDRVLDIIRSNSAMLQPRIASGRIHSNLGGIPIVYKKDSLWIPPLDGEDKPDIQEDSEFDDKVTIKINGKNLKGFVTNSIERSMNSIADSFSFTASYNVDDIDSHNLDPYTYHPVELYISGKLFMTGILEHWKPNIGAGTIDITARTKAGQVVDCNSQSTSLNYVKQTLKQIADSLLQPFGVVMEIPNGDSGIINIAKREPADKIFEFIAKLAQSKGFILNSTIQGNIKLDRANITGNPILNLVEGEPNIIDIDATYDGTQRFSSFKAISQTRGNPNNSAEVKDATVKINRPIIFSADNNEQGDIKNAALWERARSLARSAPVNVKISGWRDKNNKIILKNNIVTLYAPRAAIFTETKYLIEKVNFSQDGGKSASLSLVLPQVYSLEFPEVMPWQR